MNRSRFPLLLTAFAFCAALPTLTAAATYVPPVKTETVVGGLDNPVAVAMRATGGDLFVSESGAGRVVRITLGKDAKPEPAITGFPVGPSPDLPDLRVGPLGLAFTASDYLVVGSGGEGPGKDAVRAFNLPADHKPLALDDAKKTLTMKSVGESKTAESWFYSVAAASAPRRGHGQ